MRANPKPLWRDTVAAGGRPLTPQRVDGIGADVKSRVRAARPRPGSAIDSGAGPRPPPTPRPPPREKALRREAPASEVRRPDPPILGGPLLVPSVRRAGGVQ